MHRDDMAEDKPVRDNINNVLISGTMWLIASGLGMLSIFAIRDLFIWGVASILRPSDAVTAYQQGAFINVAHYCLMVVLAMFIIGVVIFSSEYVFKHAGEPGTIRLLARIIAVECLIVVPVALLFWR